MKSIRDKLLNYACIAAILALCFAPINKPLTNIFLVLALVGSVCGTHAYSRLSTALSHPVVKGCLFWMFVLTLSAIHAIWSGGDVASFGSSTLALAYPLLFATLLVDDQWRDRALLSFVGAIGFVLLLSWMLYFGLLPTSITSHMKLPDLYVPFKEYTQQGLSFLLMASIAFAYAFKADLSPKWRYALLALGALAMINVLFVLRSRTALITVIPLLAYWMFRSLRSRYPNLKLQQLGFALAAMMVLGGALLWNSPHFQTKVVQGVGGEIRGYLDRKEVTSTGIRIELWKQSVKMIEKEPLIGYGLQQWLPEFKKHTANFADYDAYRLGHPHQEALLFATEEGVVGLLIWIGLLIALLFYIRRLQTPYKDLYYSLVLVYVTAGLANCLWSDFTHRHTFILLLACIPFVTKPENA